MEKKLYRNEHDKAVAGVASGLADYLGVDITIIRVMFVLATIFLGGSGAIGYIVLWVVVPINNDPSARFRKFNQFYNQNPQGGSFFNSAAGFDGTTQSEQQTKWNTPNTDSTNQFEQFVPKSKNTGKTVMGLILLLLGAYFLLQELNLFPYWFSIWHLYKLWPLAIVAVGISLIFKKKSKNEWEDFKKNNETTKPFVEKDTKEDVSNVEEVKDDSERPTSI